MFEKRVHTCLFIPTSLVPRKTPGPCLAFSMSSLNDHRTLGGNWYLSPFPLCVFVGVKMGRRGWGNSSLYQAAYVLTVLSPQLMVSSIFVGEGGRGGGTFYT